MASRLKLITNLLPEVADLPQNLTTDHKVYWNDFIGDPFQAHIGPRGKKSANARTWTQEQFVGPFCDELYPTLSLEARKQYEVILGPRVYSYLTNHSSRGSTGVKVKPQTVKQRVYGHDVWRRENPEVFEEALNDYKTKSPDTTITIGFRRSLTINLFRKLPAEEQSKYREIASERLKTIRALHTLSGEDRVEFTKNAMSQMRMLIKELDQRGGLKVNAQVLYEDDSGDFHITTLVTDCMAELADSAEVDNLVLRMQDWVKETAGKGLLKDGTPTPTVYPDYDRNMCPSIPPIIGLRVIELQKILRLEFTLLWGWQGGCGRFPWEYICANLDEFIPPERRPADVILSDPSTLRYSIVVTWLEYFIMCHEGTIPSTRHIQFSKTFAGQNPIDPLLSQESSRRFELIPHQNREAWVLFFAKTVTQCHAPNGLEYPAESIAYAKHIKSPLSQQAAANFTRSQDGPELPVGGGHPKTVINGQEKELLLKWAHQLPDAYQHFVVELVDAINELQAHLPSTSLFGIWVGQYLHSMPTLLPSSPESLIKGLQFLINFWLPRDYFAPSAQANLTSRFRYFQIYIEDMLSSPLIRHAPSKTLIGGHNGVVWLVRGLILLVFNFAAVNGDLTPPCDPPSDCDVACLPLDELPNVLGYCQDLLKAIRESILVLSQTSKARLANTGNLSSTPLQAPATVPAPASPPFDILPSSSSMIAVHSNTSPSPRTAPSVSKHKRKAKKSRKQASRGPGFEDELSLGNSDKSSVEEDYEKLDPTSDGSDLDPDGFSSRYVGSNTPWPPSPHCPALSHLTSHVLPRLPDEHSAILQPGYLASDAHVFGPLITLPPASVQPIPIVYESLYDGLNIAVSKTEETLRKWNTMAETHLPLSNCNIQAAQSAAAGFPPPLKPLIQFLLTRRLAWNQAKGVALHVVNFMPLLALNARAALQLDAAIAQFWDTEARESTVGDTGHETLKKLHMRLLKGAIEAGWVYKELLAFERLSTEWSNRVSSNWLEEDESVLNSGSTLYALVAPLAAWAKVAHTLNESLRTQRKALWRSTGRPFELSRNESLWYWFGSPSPGEIPEGLDAHLSVIRGLIDDDGDDDGNVHVNAPANLPDPAILGADQQSRVATSDYTRQADDLDPVNPDDTVKITAAPMDPAVAFSGTVTNKSSSANISTSRSKRSGSKRTPAPLPQRTTRAAAAAAAQVAKPPRTRASGKLK